MEEEIPFGDNDGYVPPDVHLPILISGRDLNARMSKAFFERYPKDIR